jgi:lipopolysaccharide cholinephosphotransferase
MGRQLTLKDVQSMCLDIMQDVHDFCMNSDIPYSMSGGTLLGAVRHKGFIPWDDDVDLYMLRPDYERFVSSYTSDRYLLRAMQTERGFCLPFAHVTDMKETEVTWVKAPYSRKLGGVKIDIFPIDSVSNRREEYDAQFDKCVSYEDPYYYARKALLKFSTHESFDYNFRLLKRRIRTLNGLGAIYYTRLIDKNARRYPFGSTDYVGLTCLPIARARQCFPKELFDGTVLLDFDGHQFCAMKGYEKVLLEAFGPDYMTPPPPEERFQHNITYCYK